MCVQLAIVRSVINYNATSLCSYDGTTDILSATNASKTLLAAGFAFVAAAETLAVTPLSNITLQLPALQVRNRGLGQSLSL